MTGNENVIIFPLKIWYHGKSLLKRDPNIIGGFSSGIVKWALKAIVGRVSMPCDGARLFDEVEDAEWNLISLVYQGNVQSGVDTFENFETTITRVKFQNIKKQKKSRKYLKEKELETSLNSVQALDKLKLMWVKVEHADATSKCFLPEKIQKNRSTWGSQMTQKHDFVVHRLNPSLAIAHIISAGALHGHVSKKNYVLQCR